MTIRMLVCALVAFATLEARAQGRDTITVPSGSPLVDGRYLVPHRALYVTTVSRGDSIVSRISFELKKRLIGAGESASFRLEGIGTPDSRDPEARFFTILRHRTLETVHREERDGTGRALIVDIEPRGASGYVSPPRDSGNGAFQFALAAPSFHSAFVDAVLNGLELRAGLTIRIPVVNVAQRRGEWRVFHVVRRDSMLVNGHIARAWVVDEEPAGEIVARRFWLIREPPFFPLDESRLRNGDVRRIQQSLLPPPD